MIKEVVREVAVERIVEHFVEKEMEAPIEVVEEVDAENTVEKVVEMEKDAPKEMLAQKGKKGEKGGERAKEAKEEALKGYPKHFYLEMQVLTARYLPLPAPPRPPRATVRCLRLPFLPPRGRRDVAAEPAGEGGQ